MDAMGIKINIKVIYDFDPSISNKSFLPTTKKCLTIKRICFIYA